MTEEKTMKSKSSIHMENKLVLAVLMAALFCLPAILSGAPQQSGEPAAVAQKGFAKPKEAAEALIQAAEKFDVPALLEMLGPDGKDLVSSKDPVQDKNRLLEFAKQAREKQSVSKDPSDKNRQILSVGKQDWPLPIPIVKREGKWYFDSKAGHDEILYRRIGANELNAIEVCRGFVEAQKEYASTIHDNSGINQYAQKLISSPGKQDGLVLGECRWHAGRPDQQGCSESDRGRLLAGLGFGLQRLLFPRVEGPGPCGTSGRARLRDQGHDDRRVCACCRAG